MNRTWAVVTPARTLRDARIYERFETPTAAVRFSRALSVPHRIEKVDDDGKLRWLTADEQYELTKAEMG